MHLLQAFEMWFLLLCSSWQDFNWRRMCPSAIAELVVKQVEEEDQGGTG